MSKEVFASITHVKVSNLSAEELMLYEREKKFISDYAAALAYAEKKGKGEGIAIGDERGVKKGVDIGVLRTAKRMKAKGLNSALIAEVTGLPEDEINAMAF